MRVYYIISYAICSPGLLALLLEGLLRLRQQRRLLTKTNVCVYVYMYIYIYIDIYAYTCIYIYIYML